MLYTKEDISRYYDLSEIHYKLFWNLEKSKALHYGYWNSTTKNLHEALQNTNKLLAERAGITASDVVLDCGCGVGGSSLWLAKNIGCKATGVTLNAKQVRKATAFAKQDGTDHLVNFEENDYMQTGYPDGSFTVIWGLESVCHAYDKLVFLREAARLLKPGGKLIMTDFFKKQGLQGRDAELMKRWANGWAINDYATREDFELQLREAGFKNISIAEETPAIMRSIRILYRKWLLGVAGAKLYNFLNPKATELAKRNVDTAYLQYVTVKKGLWKYLLVYAEKA